MAIRWLADGSSIRNYVLPGPLSYSRMERHRPRTEDDGEVWVAPHGYSRRTPLAAPYRPRPGGSLRAYAEISDRLPDPADPDYFDRLIALEQSNPELVHSALGVKKPAPGTEVRRLSVDRFMARVREYQAEHNCQEEEALELVAKETPGGREALLAYMRS